MFTSIYEQLRQTWNDVQTIGIDHPWFDSCLPETARLNQAIRGLENLPDFSWFRLKAFRWSHVYVPFANIQLAGKPLDIVKRCGFSACEGQPSYKTVRIIGKLSGSKEFGI